jgi:hypothetical protein
VANLQRKADQLGFPLPHSRHNEGEDLLRVAYTRTRKVLSSFDFKHPLLVKIVECLEQFLAESINCIRVAFLNSFLDLIQQMPNLRGTLLLVC